MGYAIKEWFVDQAENSAAECRWFSVYQDFSYQEFFLKEDMRREVDTSYDGSQRPIRKMEVTSVGTGEIVALFERDNPGAAFGWSENLMELIRRFAAKNAANNTTENEEENTMNTHEMNVNTTENATTEPEPETRVKVGTCRDCGRDIYEDDDYDELPNGELVCEECVDRYYTHCEHEDCLNLVSDDDTETVHFRRGWRDETEQWCPDCVEIASARGDIARCDDCGEYWDYDSLLTDDDCCTLCPECFERGDYVRCADSSCGRIISRDNAYYSEEDDEYYCENCYEDHRSRRTPQRGKLYHYHEYKTSARSCMTFYGERKIDDGIDRTRFFGVELETDSEDASNQGEYVDALWDNFRESYFYPATDCSLDAGGSYSGVELVMMPATLDHHLNEFPWKEITDVVRQNGYSSHDVGTCGLHVHVSRASLGATVTDQDLTIAKVAILFDRHWDKLVKFSRRRYFHYCRKLDADFKRDDTSYEVIEKTKSTAQGHGMALNLENSKTVEFRIFRGTLNVNTIKATLEFVNNMVEYAMHTDLDEIMGADFADYALYHRYPELDAYLKQRSLMPAQMDEPDESVEE